MEGFLGILKLRIKRGINLAVRDAGARTSDPYVVITMCEQVNYYNLERYN